jgi:hypothetical protein
VPFQFSLEQLAELRIKRAETAAGEIPRSDVYCAILNDIGGSLPNADGTSGPFMPLQRNLLKS